MAALGKNDDAEFLEILLTLTYMSAGEREEFAFSYERLNEIADDLIEDRRPVNLDY